MRHHRRLPDVVATASSTPPLPVMRCQQLPFDVGWALKGINGINRNLVETVRMPLLYLDCNSLCVSVFTYFPWCPCDNPATCSWRSADAVAVCAAAEAPVWPVRLRNTCHRNRAPPDDARAALMLFDTIAGKWDNRNVGGTYAVASAHRAAPVWQM